MVKVFLTIFLSFSLLIGSLFFIPINFLISNYLKNSDLNIDYSYLEGNIFSGKILDLYYDNNFIGDFSYDIQFSLNNVIAHIESIDEQNIKGKVIKQFSNIADKGNFLVKDFSASSIFSTELLNTVDLYLNINELEIINFECAYINGNLQISSQEIKEELIGQLSCYEDNTISAELFNKNMKELGNVTYSNSQVKVRISTRTISDRRVQLLMDYITFTIDL